jgi:hypothetical protein
MIYLLAILAVMCLFGGLLAISLSIIGSLWRAAEYLANGVVSGCRLFCVGAFHVFVACWSLSRWSLRHASRIELIAAQAAYAWAYGAGYRLRRNYIASQLKQMRRQH